MNIIRFNTENSSYELNNTTGYIRRLSGIKDPTPRQGPDGEWKKLKEIANVEVGKCAIIVWEILTTHGEIVLRTTMTSEIKNITKNKVQD